MMRFRHLSFALCVAAALCLMACPPPGGNNNDGDAGSDAGDVPEDAFGLEIGKSSQGQFESFSNQPELEVVSGFQGGFHLEPALRVTNLPRDEFFAIVTYSVTDTSTNETLHRSPSTYRVDETAFEREGSALVRAYDRIILEVSTASEAAGREVEIRATVEIENFGTASAFTTVELVDEVDELGG